MRSCGSSASMISWVCMNQVGRNDEIVKRRRFWISEAVGVKGTSTCVTSCLWLVWGNWQACFYQEGSDDQRQVLVGRDTRAGEGINAFFLFGRVEEKAM